MKKLIPLMILALSGATGLLQAQDTVTSVNAVGMVKQLLNSGEYSMVNVPFEFADSEPKTVDEIFGDSLPQNSAVLFWDESSQTYLQVLRGRNSWGGSGSEILIDRFVGMFILVPSNTEFIFSGEVPDQRAEHQKSVTINPGYNMLGNPFPTTATIAQLGFDSVQNDAISIWVNNQYINIVRGRISWGSSDVDVNTFEIQPGQSFFYFSSRSPGNNWVWSPAAQYTIGSN